MNKKVNISLYYTGLVAGILIINYIFKIYPEHTESIIIGLEEIRKINFVKGQELFFYLLSKRVKQILFYFLIYFHISRPLSLLLFNLYFSCMEGIVLSIYTYTKGALYMIIMSLTLLPHLICFFALEMAGWNYHLNHGFKYKIDMTNALVFVSSVAILSTIIEMYVNLSINKLILNYI